MIECYVKQTFLVNHHQNSICNLLKSLDISWATSRSKHSKQFQEALLGQWVNKEIMQQLLEIISKRTKFGRHAVNIMDDAGWHTDDFVQQIENQSVMKLPYYSPGLNPVEQLWSWLR